ncbi:hypothetical protein EII12_06635 [Buchananella hordeovulneris]|uniref:hypothetical protein n=1 Tax=Buchananella hordeovulneris TaxID=52770 RepID=UPI000F5E81A3|nr:hypothetical protein [Buchananella hordeovulneris]RRD51944.1 hypothetical protein EII12_06635 [Buchananella hordeovulneris]
MSTALVQRLGTSPPGPVRQGQARSPKVPHPRRPLAATTAVVLAFAALTGLICLGAWSAAKLISLTAGWFVSF